MARVWNTKARVSMPTAVIAQPMRIAPVAAPEAMFCGIEKIPPPIIEPTTKAVRAPSLSLLESWDMNLLLLVWKNMEKTGVSERRRRGSGRRVLVLPATGAEAVGIILAENRGAADISTPGFAISQEAGGCCTATRMNMRRIVRFWP